MTTRMTWRRFILIGAILLIAGLASGAEDPVTERGFSPEKLYQFGNLDSVNLFNGNLIVTLPVGQGYAVSSKLGYQLMLGYNSTVWDLSTGPIGTPGTCDGPDGYLYIPNRKSNAGMGWSLGFGRLFPPCHPSNEGQNMPPPVFESPDGGSHGFYASADNGDTRYTTDNSHLRLRHYLSNTVSLDFPDGTTYTYSKNACDEYLLQSVSDPSGNSVQVTWDSGRYNQTITDLYGRQTVIHYANALSNDAYDRVVSSIDVPVFATGTTPPASAKATYSFDYLYPTLDLPSFNAPCYGYTFVTPMLHKVRRPDGSAFEFEYGYNGVNSNHIGTHLVQITLPTKGQIQWNYGAWELPAPTCELVTPWPTAVTARKFIDPLTSTTETWTYDSVLDAGPFDDDPYYCPLLPGNPYLQWPKEQKRTIIIDPKGDKTVHYFSVWQGRRLNDPAGPIDPSPNGYESRDQGLSLTKLQPSAGGAFLSSQAFDCGGTGTCGTTPDRSFYTLYEHHRPPDGDLNVHDPWDVMPVKTRTVFDKDAPVTGTAAFVDVSSSDYDGYGHYRVVTTSGNFGLNGALQSRTVTTNYNGVDLEVGNPATHSDIKPGSGTWGLDFTAYPSTEKWILGTFTSMKTEATVGSSVHSSKQLFLFDRDTGFLKRTRVRRGGAASDGRYTDSGNNLQDLLTVFEPTTAVSGTQAAGEMAAETHYGGDVNLLPDTTTPLADLSLGSAPAGMRSVHTYKYGSLATSQKTGGSYLSANLDIDRNTGYPKSSTDPAGRTTTYEFNNMSRISKKTLPLGTIDDYTYPITTRAFAISSMHPASSSTPLLKTTYAFDGFGRVASVRDLMANGSERERTMTWNALGQKTAETEEAAVGSTGVQTTYQYDAFGRQISVVPPDGEKHALTVQYSGIRIVTSTTGKTTSSGTGGIGMSLDGSGNVTETPAAISVQELDAFSRLSKATEYGQGGTPTAGSYSYDVGGRLTSASIAAPEGTQTRSFIYDNRGFLLSQTQPENGTTSFENYDAYGHAGRRLHGTSGGPFDLTFTYDIYQRLTEVYRGSTLLKKTTFDSLPSGDPEGSYSAPGQIVKTYRRNDLTELGGDVPVYTYLRYDSAGRLNQKKTVVGTGPSFTQGYTYNETGDLTTLTYPSCSGCTPLASGTSMPGRTLSFGWSHGYLTGVDEGTTHFTSATAGKLIDYWPSGMLKSVTHVAADNTHEVTDSQTLDQGMARPGTITFTGMSSPSCTPPAAGITAPSSMPAGGTSTASVPATTGATYVWTIQNGSITSGQGTTVITFTGFCGSTSVILGVTVSTSPSCSASGSKTIAMTGSSNATAVVSGSQTITQGGAAEIWAQLSGTPPYTLTWSDGAVQSGMTFTQVPRMVSPSTTTTYTAATIADANGCGTTSGSATVTVSGTCTPSNAAITGPSTVPAGGTVTLTFSDPAGASNGKTYNATVVSSTSNTITFRAGCVDNITVTYTIYPTATRCGSTATKTVTLVKSNAFVSGSQTISPYGTAQISASLSGTAPFWITWSDGFTQSNVTDPVAYRNVSPGTTTTYTVIDVTDGNGCGGTSSGAAVVQVCTPPDTTINAPTSVPAGGTFTATCNLTAGMTCSWSATYATLLSSTSSSATYRADCNVNATVYLTVSSGSCTATSSKGVSIVKSTVVVSGSQTITQPNSATITATLTGTAPWSLTWSDGFVQSGITSSPAQRSVTPNATTTYTVNTLTDGNNCAGTKSGAAVVAVNLAPPTNLVATAVSTSQINVSWAFSGTATRFDLYRNGTVVYSGPALSYSDTGLPPSTAYWYKVIAVVGTTVSADSNRDIATTILFADTPVVAAATTIQAQHINQLRSAVNAVRAAAGLGTATFTDSISPGVLIRAIHITELRTALDQARSTLLLPPVAYERSPLTSIMLVKVRDVTDLRGGVQ